jgi:TolB-like protein
MGSSRRLAAIMFADIEGYTALMHADEGHADQLRQKFQRTLTQEVDNHQGQTISIKGDGALCIFSSSVNAVRAATAIQLKMRQDPEIPLRIGIHEADIIVDNDDVFGDGVNLASRLESFSVPGSVLISENVQREIKNHPEIQSTHVGKFRFKNLKEAIDVFAVSNPGLIVPVKTKMKGKGQLHTNKTGIYVSLSVLLIMSIVTFLYFRYLNHHPSLPIEKSIAVLPFANISNNPSNEYFCDGITEDIITSLVKIANLKVISRTSVMQYKSTKQPLKKIAESLNVSTILEGSVQLVNDQVRITAQLIDAETDSHLWAESYDEKFDQVLAIQNRISQKIASSLLITMSPNEKTLIQRQNSGNTEAYKRMLQARYFRQKLGEGNLEKAQGLIGQALAIDSTDARILTEAGSIYINKGETWSGLENYAKGLELVNKALAIDSTIAEGYSIRSQVKMTYSFEWNAADADIQKARRLEPGSAEIMSQAATLALTLGRAGEATALVQRALEVDPLNLWTMQMLAFVYQVSGKPREAVATFRKVLDLQPDRAFAHGQMGLSYLLLGKPDSALAELKKEQHEGLRLYGEALAYAALHNTGSSEKACKELMRKFPGLVDYQIAAVYSFRGEKDLAFTWLQTAYDHRDGGLASLKYDPFLNNVRNDPRYFILLKRLKLE